MTTEIWEPEPDESWRGDCHPDEAEEEWPEWSAGPEYWMFRRMTDEDDPDAAHGV